MTDIEITKLCAEAMGYMTQTSSDGSALLATYKVGDLWTTKPFDPLHDDAQAMALVKAHRLLIRPTYPPLSKDGWWFVAQPLDNLEFAEGLDLNRAICECVAKMQKAKDKP